MSDVETSWEELTSSDGTKLGAYRAKPRGETRGGVVVIQEIFGVNGHIRSVAEGYARQGYDVLAPALFDRVERGVELGYDESGMKAGRELVMKLGFDNALLDLDAAVTELAASGKKVGAVGYCWGGSVAFLAAGRLPRLSAAVGYYGSTIIRFVNVKPVAPLLLHFGETDKSIPPEDVATIRRERPEAEIHVYAAGHGFNCDQRANYDEASAKLALSRTLAFFHGHVG